MVSQSIGAPHGFTTRLGGVSTGILASMNIGPHRGDSRENLLKNYEILGRAMGFRPEDTVLAHQTHTDIICLADASYRGRGLFGPELPDCDGLITATPGLALVVFSADCTPVLLWDKETGAVGAVHAGWRGTAQDIPGKAVKAMAEAFGTKPENLYAAVGPHVCKCCFETDADVPEKMREAYGADAEAAIARTGEKFHVDLTYLNKLALTRAGVKHIDSPEICTVCDEELFWSHRRTGGNRGSQGAIIVCKEPMR